MLGTKRLFGIVLSGAAFALNVPQVALAKTPTITAQTLIERAQIADLLTRYYYNLGHSSADSFAAFYADDAEMILGNQTFKGKEGIGKAYQGTADSPQRKAYAFNISISNPLITVDGNSAKAQIIFTEIIIDKQGDPPRVLVQGREYDTLAKVKGEWRFKRRQIMPGAQVPDGWTN
jgi:ketosteroid isomerase-like protein